MPSGKQNTPSMMEKMVGRMMGRPAPYAERLQFAPPRGGTGDLDETQISQAMLDQVGQKLKYLVGRAGRVGRHRSRRPRALAGRVRMET